MSTLDTVANVARGWNQSPAGTIAGTGQTSVSAALWQSASDEVLEITAEPDRSRHMLSLMLSNFAADDELDGKLSYSGHRRPGMINLVRAGQRPRGIIYGAFSGFHLYVPDLLIHSTAIEAGLEDVELLDPRCARDSQVWRIGREMLAEMRADIPLSRLRIDALGQKLAIYLVRTYSQFAGTRALRPNIRGGLAPSQLKRVTEALRDGLHEDIGLLELARLAGLSPAHSRRPRACRPTLGCISGGWSAPASCSPTSACR